MFCEISPPEPLRFVIDSLWRSTDPSSQWILPDGCTDIIFLPDAEAIRVVSIMTQARMTPQLSSQEVFGMRFQPWVAGAILRNNG